MKGVLLMTVTAKITSKGQITLPKEVRRALNVKVGEIIAFEKRGRDVVVKSVKTLKDYKGALKSRDKKISFDEMRKEAKKYVSERVTRS